ncbi:MAG: hypothetical protein LBB48_07810 [Treponema sp.]|jgi:hypothetical protein|nr:hypothetical protein [Treponema sp.]
MNKRIVAISVLLLMLLAVTASVFADDSQPREYQYTVTVNYQDTHNKFKQMQYTVWATSAREAETQAMALCKYDIEVKGLGNVSSCAAPNATGKSRPAQ